MIVKNDLSLCLHLEKLTQRLSDNQCFLCFSIRYMVRYAYAQQLSHKTSVGVRVSSLATETNPNAGRMFKACTSPTFGYM